MHEKSCEETVKDIKNIAELLIPYTFPKVDFKTEQQVLALKQTNLTIDGFDLITYYSKSDYQDHYLESLQLQSLYAPFLPFTVVCKAAQLFLGFTGLSYIEFFRNSRKIYCWTLRTADGKRLPPDKKSKPSTFEGFSFNVLLPGTIDLV
jgi:hypothetical protein